MHKIVIEANEIEHLIQVSLLRCSHNRMSKRPGLNIMNCLQGCIGELAFAKYFNFFPDFTWETRTHTGTSSKWYDFKLNNGKTYDIKTSPKDSFAINQQATTFKNQPDYFVFVQTPIVDLNKQITDQTAIIHGYSTIKNIRNCFLSYSGKTPFFLIKKNNIKSLTRKQYA
jgi:hypothetical protein